VGDLLLHADVPSHLLSGLSHSEFETDLDWNLDKMFDD